MCNLRWIRNTLPAGNGFQGCTMRFSLSRQTENELQSQGCFSSLSFPSLPFPSLPSPLSTFPSFSPPHSSFSSYLIGTWNLCLISFTWKRRIAALLLYLAEGEPQRWTSLCNFVHCHHVWAFIFWNDLYSINFHFSLFSGNIKKVKIEVRMEKYTGTASYPFSLRSYCSGLWFLLISG